MYTYTYISAHTYTHILATRDGERPGRTGRTKMRNGVPQDLGLSVGGQPSRRKDVVVSRLLCRASPRRASPLFASDRLVSEEASPAWTLLVRALLEKSIDTIWFIPGCWLPVVWLKCLVHLSKIYFFQQLILWTILGYIGRTTVTSRWIIDRVVQTFSN